jgi:predicted GNAT family N-acyltransferase
VSTVEIARNGVGSALHLARACALSNDELSIDVLPSAASRRLIDPLRRYADFGSEYEIDPGMAELEGRKDELGIVMAISQHDEPVATIRFIPTGHGLTLTERYWRHAINDSQILGHDSWEVGRLVMAPEHRRSDLLPRCMAMSLGELLRTVRVRHFHASCLARMTRLYRRFGFDTHCVSDASGKECALIHGAVEQVARALKVPLEGQFTMLQ